MKVYTLKYRDKSSAIKDFIDKNLIYGNDTNQYREGIDAIVEIGFLVETPASYNEEGYELSQSILADGYHYVVKSQFEIDFGNKEIFPDNPICIFY